MHKSLETNKRDEEESKRLTDEYLAKGGTITVHEYAATTPIEDRPKPAWGKGSK